jgi:uncharacterized protein YbaA (DUF1428 family)
MSYTEFYVLPVKAARIEAAVMQDPIFTDMEMDAVPVDGKRIFWGGFTTLVQG